MMQRRDEWENIPISKKISRAGASGKKRDSKTLDNQKLGPGQGLAL